jgi:hypothetical protein
VSGPPHWPKKGFQQNPRGLALPFKESKEGGWRARLISASLWLSSSTSDPEEEEALPGGAREEDGTILSPPAALTGVGSSRNLQPHEEAK